MANNRIYITCKICFKDDPSRKHVFSFLKTYLDGYYFCNGIEKLDDWLKEHSHPGEDNFLKFTYENDPEMEFWKY